MGEVEFGKIYGVYFSPGFLLIAYPDLLFDHDIVDCRGMACSLLALDIGDGQGVGEVEFGKIYGICFSPEFLRLSVARPAASGHGRGRVRQDLRHLLFAGVPASSPARTGSATTTSSTAAAWRATCWPWTSVMAGAGDVSSSSSSSASGAGVLAGAGVGGGGGGNGVFVGFTCAWVGSGRGGLTSVLVSSACDSCCGSSCGA